MSALVRGDQRTEKPELETSDLTYLDYALDASQIPPRAAYVRDSSGHLRPVGPSPSAEENDSPRVP